MNASTTERPGLLRRGWRLLDASRRAAMNLLFLLTLVVLLALLVLFIKRGPPALQDNTALLLGLQGTLVEQRSGSVTDRIRSQAIGQPDGQVQLRDLLAVLEAAAQDPKITRVVLLLDDFQGAGMAQLREAAAAIERFKASGKPVVAWSANYDQRQYYLAAASVQPDQRHDLPSLQAAADELVPGHASAHTGQEQRCCSRTQAAPWRQLRHGLAGQAQAHGGHAIG